MAELKIGMEVKRKGKNTRFIITAFEGNGYARLKLADDPKGTFISICKVSLLEPIEKIPEKKEKD